MTASKAVVPHQSGLELLEKALDEIPWAADEATSEEAIASMIDAIFSADADVEDILAGGAGTRTFKDLAGEVIMITDVVKRQGDYGSAYLQLSAHVVGDLDGELILISCGARKPVAKVAKIYADGLLPFRAKVFVGTSKSTGRSFYDLLPDE